MAASGTQSRSAADAIAEVAERGRSRSQPRRDLPSPPDSDGNLAASMMEFMKTMQTQQMQLFEAQQNMMASFMDRPQRAETLAPTTNDFIKTVPQDVLALIEKRGRELKDNILKHARAQRSLAKAQTDFEMLKNNRYPSGSRPFKSSLTFIEHDSAFDRCVTEPHTISIVIPVGATRRDALAKFHIEAATFYKEIDIEALRELVAHRMHESSPDAFRNVVDELLVEATDPQAAESLGLPRPIAKKMDPRILNTKVEEIYSRIYGEINDRIENENVSREAKNSEGRHCPRSST